MKFLLGYGACALALLFTLWLWHEKDKEVDALNIKLEQANVIIKEKDAERDREQKATTERDQRFAEQDKKLDTISRNLRNLAATNQEMRDVLNTRIPPELLRGLRTYGGEHEAESPGTISSKTGDRK